jgi:hypothetical protein
VEISSFLLKMMGEGSNSTNTVSHIYVVYAQACGTSWPLTCHCSWFRCKIPHLCCIHTSWWHHLTLDPHLDITLALSQGTPALYMLHSDGSCKIPVHATMQIGYFLHFLYFNGPSETLLIQPQQCYF